MTGRRPKNKEFVCWACAAVNTIQKEGHGAWYAAYWPKVPPENKELLEWIIESEIAYLPTRRIDIAKKYIEVGGKGNEHTLEGRISECFKHDLFRIVDSKNHLYLVDMERVKVLKANGWKLPHTKSGRPMRLGQFTPQELEIYYQNHNHPGLRYLLDDGNGNARWSLEDQKLKIRANVLIESEFIHLMNYLDKNAQNVKRDPNYIPENLRLLIIRLNDELKTKDIPL